VEQQTHSTLKTWLGIRGTGSEPAKNVWCHVSHEWQSKTSEAVSSMYQTIKPQHENRRAVKYVDEDCVDSRSRLDDPRTRDGVTVCMARVDK